ncbi:MAG: VCBS repeat-containing protein [Desulfuromusa sp.]|nr:VCBS repeat-containing protein [Desulfuromusa sp.]
MRLIKIVSLLLLCCFPLTAGAEIPEQLKNDFSPISGIIIMPIGEKYLVDLDASTNLQEGDILTLLMAGEKIINPITKEFLGTIEQPKGYLQVIEVKSGYSYVKVISAEIKPVKGDVVKRFEQTPTRFTENETANNLAAELQLALPHLNWLSATDQTNPELIFMLVDNNLKIINAAGVELKSYPYKGGELSVPMAGINHPDSFPLAGTAPENRSKLNQVVHNLSSLVGIDKKDKRLENPAITQSQQLNDNIWTGQNLDGNPLGITVADLDGDGLLETAVAMEDHLRIFRMTDGKMALVARVNFTSGVHLLSLDAADIDADGTFELYLSANVGKKLSSQVVEFIQGSYQSTITSIPWFFRSVDLLEEGQTLIAQTMNEPANPDMPGTDNPFAAHPFRVVRTGENLSQGAELLLPAQINLFSFIPIKGAANDLLYTYVTSREYLHVMTPGGVTIWQSADHYGGSETYFYNKKIDTRKEMAQPIYIQHRLLTLPTGEILSARNEGFSLLQRLKKYNKSRIVALKWDGLTLRESWQTAQQDGYLADFSLADADNDGQDELVMVVNFKRKNLLQKGRSAVVIYELNQ